MADASIPGAVVNESPVGLPLESQPVSTGTGMAASFGASMRSTLGVSLETQASGLIQGGDMIPYDQVEKVFKDQKLDPSVFAKGRPVRRGEALAVFGQQLAIQKDQDLAERAHLGAVSGGLSGFAGGLADPLVIGSGLIAGPLLGAARTAVGARAIETGAPLLGRALTGAAEGGAGVAAYEKAEQKLGSAQGDRDITTGQILHDAMWGSVAGGILKGAFGARPNRVDLEPYREMVVGAENTAGYAKAHGMNPDDVVSKAGAVGIHQITPDTAKMLGFSGDIDMLKNHDYNAQVAQANLEHLYKRYGDDPEAIAVAWNAGPGVADKFVKASHDRSMLPKETQDYLTRIDKMKGTGNVAAPGATPPAVAVGAKDNNLVVARKMPDGSVMYGDRGDVHANLLSDAELDGDEQVDPATMGFAEKNGPWMSREEAAKFVGSDQVRLESVRNEMAKAGLKAGPFGRAPTMADANVAKVVLAQAEKDSEIRPEAAEAAARDEANGLRATGLGDAIPATDSATINPMREKLAAIEASKPKQIVEPTTGREPHPALAEIQRLAAEAKEEAQSIHQGLTGEVAGAENNGFEAYMSKEAEKFDISEGVEQKPDFQNALEAAVQCGLNRGTE